MKVWFLFRRLFGALLAMAFGLSCARPLFPAPSPEGGLTVDFISVGHGDAALLISKTGKSALIDGGQAEDAPKIIAHLQKRKVCPLDVILLTHRHSDHLGGLRKIIEDCGARLFMDSPYPHQSRQYSRLLETIEARQVAFRQAEAGRRIDLGGGAVLTLLGPPQPFLGEGEAGVNANSVVVRLSLGKNSVLFMGDAEALEEGWLISQSATLRSGVLKVGHHGSRTSSTKRFLQAVSPRFAILSTEANDPKHPHPDTLERLAAVGARILVTAQEGTIHLTMDSETMAVRSEQHPKGVP